ncbi:MAG: polyprenyl synthetase family protein, partial [Xanthomonadaceae bacterium]|nr:polyprenyl synthetase family protein [Xanthomonadaceae bacterium]
MSFNSRADDYVKRVEAVLDRWLPGIEANPSRLHQAMRYSVFNGGKRIRPLLCYAAAEAIGLDVSRADPLAAAVELVHCYS